MHVGLDLVQSKISTLDTEGLIEENLYDNIYHATSELVPVIRESIKRYIAQIVFE